MNAKKASACELSRKPWPIGEEIDPKKWDQERYKEIQHDVEYHDIDTDKPCPFDVSREFIKEAFKKDSYTRRLLTQLCAGAGVKVCDALMYLKATRDAYDYTTPTPEIDWNDYSTGNVKQDYYNECLWNALFNNDR
jgi:hypothetical protein